MRGRPIAWALVCAVAGCGAPSGTPSDLGVPPDDLPAFLDLTSAGGDAALDLSSLAGCTPAPQAGHQEVTCADGTRFDVESSAACASGGCGVILDIHGYTMTGDEEDLHTLMRAIAPPAGYVVVQPSATGSPPTWGVAPSHPADVTVWAFLEATLQRFQINPKKIHVMGLSQGAMMTFRFICAHADQIASAAPVAGGSCFVSEATFGGVATATNQAPSEPVPLLYVHGTQDKLVSFTNDATPLRSEMVKAWSLGATTPIRTDGKLRATTRSGTGRAVLEFWEHDYISSSQDATFIGGHCVPGPITAGDGVSTGSGARFRCLEPGQFDFGMEALRFFQAHPRP